MHRSFEQEEMMTEDVYKKLAKHLASLGMGYPEKEELMEILRENFTPLEAEVALAIPTKVIPFDPVSVSEIAPPQNISKKDLESILSNLAQRGLLFSKKMKDGSMGYALQQFGYGFPQTFFWRGVNTPIVKKDGRADRQIFRERTTQRSLWKYKNKGVPLSPCHGVRGA
jgi:hypothetical protein